jgi:hypothetical protein
MNDDGSDPHVLVPASADPAMGEGFSSAAVDPNAGSTVAFDGATLANEQSFLNDECYNAISGFYNICPTYHYGFNYVGAYTLINGAVKRLTAAAVPSGCPDGCTTADDYPQPVPSGSVFFDYFQSSGRTGSYGGTGGDYESSNAVWTMQADGSSRTKYAALPCTGALFAGGITTDIALDWASPATVAFNGCNDSTTHTPVIDTANGTSISPIAAAPSGVSSFSDFAFSADGTQLVAAASGYKLTGLYLYGSGSTTPVRQLLSSPTGTVGFSSPHFLGSGSIVFSAQDNIWTIPASCNGCVFPTDATQLTTDGQSAGPAWTSAAVAPAGSGSGSGGSSGSGNGSGSGSGAGSGSGSSSGSGSGSGTGASALGRLAKSLSAKFAGQFGGRLRRLGGKLTISGAPNVRIDAVVYLPGRHSSSAHPGMIVAIGIRTVGPSGSARLQLSLTRAGHRLLAHGHRVTVRLGVLVVSGRTTVASPLRSVRLH